MAGSHSGAGGEQPVPIIDPACCTGCGLCVKACPTGALAMSGSRAVVARPAACEYTGDCERICPMQAIRRPFQIVFVSELSKGDRR